MKLLLDTHTFIWWNSTPQLLSKQALDLLEDESHSVTIRVVNLWEIQIKQAAGKMDLNIPLDSIVKPIARTVSKSSLFMQVIY